MGEKIISIDANVHVANKIKDLIDCEIVSLKSKLHDMTEDLPNMDMVGITVLVGDINTLSEVSNQINVKLQFGAQE